MFWPIPFWSGGSDGSQDYHGSKCFLGDMPCTGLDIEWVLERVAAIFSFVLKGDIKVLIYTLTFPGKQRAVRAGAGAGTGPEKQGAFPAISVNFIF